VKGLKKSESFTPPGPGDQREASDRQIPASSPRSTDFSPPDTRSEGTLYDSAHLGVGDIMNTTAISPDVCASISDTFEHNLTTFQRLLESMERSPKTIDVYIRSVTSAAKVLDSDPYDWSEEDQNTFLFSDTYRRWSPNYRDTLKSVLKTYWKLLRRKDLLGHPTFFTRRRKVSGGTNGHEAKRVKAIPQDEVEEVIEECRRAIRDGSPSEVYRHFALLLQAAYGLRCVGVAHLRVCDIRIEEDVLHVHNSKGGKSRDVHMDVSIGDEFSLFMSAREAVVRDLLRKPRGHDVAKHLTDLISRADTPLFFNRSDNSSEVGAPVDPRAVGEMTGRIASQIVGRHVHPHQFRHSKAFYLLEVAHLDMQQAASYLGHSNIQTTYDYAGVDVADQKVAFARTEKVTETRVEVTTGAPSDFEEKARVLGELHKSGVLTTEAFGEAMSRLLSGSK